MSITIPSKYPKRKATCFRLGFAYHELDHTILMIIDLIDMSFGLIGGKLCILTIIPIFLGILLVDRCESYILAVSCFIEGPMQSSSSRDQAE